LLILPWFCFNKGFLSVVADKDNPDRLMVRARRKSDLTNIFGPNADVVETPEADYRWRTFVDRKSFKALVNTLIDVIDYTNFKNSVKEDDLHDLYTEFWNLHRRYGTQDPALPGHNRSGAKAHNTDRSSHFVWNRKDLDYDPPKESSPGKHGTASCASIKDGGIFKRTRRAPCESVLWR
jgi:hypothetical protein